MALLLAAPPRAKRLGEAPRKHNYTRAWLAGSRAQTTLSLSFSETLAPPSSVQVNSSSPGPGTRMKKTRYGLEEMPGCSSALKTSAPAKDAVKLLIIKRGTGLPLAS